METQDTNLEVNKKHLVENMKQLNFSKTYSQITAGFLSGLLGYNGLQGLLVYMMMFFLTILVVNMKT